MLKILILYAVLYIVLSYILIPILIIVSSRINYTCDTFTDYRFKKENREAHNNITVFGNVWLVSPITLLLFILELLFNLISFIGENLADNTFKLIQISTKK